MSNPNLLDPALEEVLESVKPSDEIEIAVRLKNPDDVPAELRVISLFGDVITCRIQAGSVREVRSSPSIISVKYNRPLPLGYDPQADIETAYEELTLRNSYNDVYRIPREFGGEGVLIAFLDWGIAYAEKAFLDENNETRFLAIWDQGAEYSSEKPNKYGYGRIFLKDEINASLKTDDPYSFLGYHPAKADPLGLGSHGTHVCDIAAGSRRKIQNGYIQGIANKSELIFVDLQADDTKGLSSLSASIPFLEAIHFVSDTAGNRPLVVNISAGSHGGPHDDSSLVVRAIDNLVSMNPGRIVVMSTGNYKMNQTHTEGIVKSGREKQFNWIIHETTMSDKELEIWYPGSDIFSLGIMLPGGKEFLFTQSGEKKSIIANGVEVGKSYHRKDPLNNDHHIDIFIYKGAPVGKWKILLYGNDVVDGRYYAWIERDIDPRYQSKFEINDSVINSTIGSICTGRQSIVVGAFDPRTSERKLAEFSSLGPTRNGIDKPDICAPGVDIIAAKSTPLNAKPPTSVLVSKSGVSMATPYVSGAVATLHSASKRMLTISDIRRILLGSADKCSDDNSCCGYGYLNIDTALGKVLDLTRHEYMMKENIISKQKNDQDINHSSKVENFHDPLQIKSTAISDSKFVGKMLNNAEHGGESNKLDNFSEDENTYYTNYAAAPKAESEIIKIVDDFIASSQGNIPHSVLLNHVLSMIGAFNIPRQVNPGRDYELRKRDFLLSLKNNLSPEMIYNIFTLPQYRYSITRYHDIFEVVARPGTKIFGKLNSGDLSIRYMSANYCHLAFIVSPEIMTFGDLVRNNFIAERSNQSEGYVHVVEGKPRHRITDRFARIICDNYGVVLDNRIVVRIKFRGTSDPSINLSDNLSTYDYDRFADPSLFQEDQLKIQPPQQKFEASLKPTLDLNTVITRARGIISRLNVSGKPNENQKRRIINIYNCLLNKAQDPNVRDFYIAYPDYVHYRHTTYGGASHGDLMKEGFIDSSGKWIKFRFVRDFLRKPVYFDYNKTDEDYLKSLALLYNEIDETMTNIRQYLEQREAGGQAARIQQLALFISREGKNNRSIYSCWGGVSSLEELSEGEPSEDYYHYRSSEASSSNVSGLQETSLAMRPVRARILWPALGFPSVINPTNAESASSGSGDNATNSICVLLLADHPTLTPQRVATYLRYVPWSDRGRRHLDDQEDGKFRAEDITVSSNLKLLEWKISSNVKQFGRIIRFGADNYGNNGILATLSNDVTDFYSQTRVENGKTKDGLKFLYEIRVSKAASGKLKDGQYHLFWNNEDKNEDALSDEMKFLLLHHGDPVRRKHDEKWYNEHKNEARQEYEYEYGELQPPYKTDPSKPPRIRAEILHPLFVLPRRDIVLKIGHITDTHLDARINVYEANYRRAVPRLRALAASKHKALPKFSNWNLNFTNIYNDAKSKSDVILLTGDLIDYGRGFAGVEYSNYLGTDGYYQVDRNWFLFYYLLASGKSYERPVYTILGNHDWRLNPYPPFAIAGTPSPRSMFIDNIEKFTSKEQEDEFIKELEEYVKSAHGDRHDRRLSYDDKIETPEIHSGLEDFKRKYPPGLGWLKFLAVTKIPIRLIGQLIKTGPGPLDKKGIPTETTIDSVKWYLFAINPFLDYWFKHPNGQSILMLDWAKDENVVFGQTAHGEQFPDMANSDEGPTARSCLTDIQVELVKQFLGDDRTMAKVIGIHAPPIGVWGDWYDDELRAGWKNFTPTGRGNRNLSIMSHGKLIKGHPLFAITPSEKFARKGAVYGMDAVMGTFNRNREWFITQVADQKHHVRLVVSGHNHRSNLLTAYKASSNLGFGAEVKPGDNFGNLVGSWLIKQLSKNQDKILEIPPPGVAGVRNRILDLGKGGIITGPLYANGNSAGPRGHGYYAKDVNAYVDPGYWYIELKSDGTIKEITHRPKEAHNS
jgi:subtilisin family serine protease